MKVRYNDRGVKENFSSGEHKNIATLKQEKTLLNEAGIARYLSKDSTIPRRTRVPSVQSCPCHYTKRP